MTDNNKMGSCQNGQSCKSHHLPILFPTAQSSPSQGGMTYNIFIQPFGGAAKCVSREGSSEHDPPTPAAYQRPKPCLSFSPSISELASHYPGEPS
jgi:hypothetical protein